MTLEEIRAQHQVRLMETSQEGCAIGKLPPGVFGFAYAPGQDDVPVFAKCDYHCFEVHKAADGAEYVIGFATSEEAQKINRLEDGASVALFPDAQGGAQTLVAVPCSHILAPKKLLVREDGNPFHFKIS